MRTLTIRLLFFVFAVASSAASATGVVYNWLSLTSNPNLMPMFGSIVFDEAYWSPNRTFSFSTLAGGGIYPEAAPGLLSFSFGGGLAGDSSTADYSPFPCGLRDDCTLDENKLVVYGSYDLSLTLGSVLTGYADVNDTSTNVRMESASGTPVWTVGTFRTDGPGPGPCFLGDYCSGGTGLWVLDLNTVPIVSPVPEPEAYAMWIAGLAALGIASRRRKRVRELSMGTATRTRPIKR